MQPSLFIFRVEYVASYQVTERAIKTYIHELGLPEPYEVIIKVTEPRHRNHEINLDVITYMVYVNWKLKPIGWIE